jgi:hypothetical protein
VRSLAATVFPWADQMRVGHEWINVHHDVDATVTDLPRTPANTSDRGARETAHLLRSPINAQRLADSIAELDGGGGVEHDLVDPD